MNASTTISTSPTGASPQDAASPSLAAKPRLHPLLTAAAVSVTVFSLMGVAAMTGLLPHAQSTTPSVQSAAAEGAAKALVPEEGARNGAEVNRSAEPLAPPAEPRPAAAPRSHRQAPLQVRSGAASNPAANGSEAGQMAAAPICASCGVVESVRAVEVEGSGSGLGAVAGGVTGGLVGNQMGNGNGRTAMTLLGAVGGAFAGNAIEKNVRKETTYRITVRMDDGSYRTVSQSHVPAVAVGDKVKVVNGTVTART